MANEQISKVSVPVTVVGLPQSLYEVEGELGGLDRAIAYVESGAVDAIELLAKDETAVVRERQKRTAELGRALAEVNRAKSWLNSKENVGDLYEGNVGYAYSLQDLRGYNFGLRSSSVTKGEIDEVVSRVQHESSLMDSRLNQAMTALNDYVARRDKIYSQLEKAMDKISSGMAKTIREMGD